MIYYGAKPLHAEHCDTEAETVRNDLKRRIWLAAACLAICLCAGAALAESTVQMNEIMLSTAKFEGGKAYEWIELHNTDANSVSIRDWKLTYERKNEAQTYVFPAGSKVDRHGYLVVLLTGLDQVENTAKALYAPIDVSRKGGTFTLYDADGAQVDRIELDAQYGDISFGRVADGGEWLFLGEASRGAANSQTGYAERARRADLSVSGGFYDAAPELTALTEKDAVVRYTLNGTEPSAASPAFSEYSGLKKGVTTLRVRAFAEGKLPSETTTQTYFVGVSRNVPVVSLVTDDKYLFAEKTGLLVPGSAKRPNYYQDWEYPINVEYYNADHKQEINQGASFRVTGATSRAYAQKAISLFARSALGPSSFEFNPFPNREGYTEYKAITLRAGGTESYKTRFKDAMLTRLALGTGLFYQESATCVVYINGQYWGQYNLRERINKDSLAAFEGITDKQTIHDVTIIKGRGEVSRGDIGEWNSLISYMKNHDLREEQYLNYVLERFDVDNYFTMVAFQVILGNGDIGNQRFYKFPGGKWKYVLYDLDAAMQNTKRTPFGYFLKAAKSKNKLFYHEPFITLIKNDQMKEKFLTICSKLLTEKYVKQDLLDQIDEWVDTLEPLMAEQITRWKKCSPKSVDSWMYEVNAFKKIVRSRYKYVINYLSDYFRLDKEQKAFYFGQVLENNK